MGEPLARIDTAAESILAGASQRLERALQTLEAALGRCSSGVSDTARVVELKAVRQRSRELETAAAETARTLGRAMAEVRRALDEDETGAYGPPSGSGLLEGDLFDSALESDPGLGDDHNPEAAEPAADKEPTE